MVFLGYEYLSYPDGVGMIEAVDGHKGDLTCCQYANLNNGMEEG